jgi:hypothetical protein
MGEEASAEVEALFGCSAELFGQVLGEDLTEDVLLGKVFGADSEVVFAAAGGD